MSSALEFLLLAGDVLSQCIFVGIIFATAICVITFGIACAIWAFRTIRNHW